MDNLLSWLIKLSMFIPIVCLILTIYLLAKSKRKKKKYWASNRILKAILLLGSLIAIIFIAHTIFVVSTIPAPNKDAQISYYNKKYKNNFDDEQINLRRLAPEEKTYLCEYFFNDSHEVYSCNLLERIENGIMVIEFKSFILYLLSTTFYNCLLIGILIILLILKKFVYKFPPSFQKYLK